MRTVLPGKPQASLQAVSTVEWQGKRLIAYISGNALIILDRPQGLIQTTYHDQCQALNAVVIDEVSGKIATSSSKEIYIYRPYGLEEGALKWSLESSFPKSDKCQNTPTLSWGSEEELLVGASSLRLHLTTEESGRVIWDRKLSNPIKIASFSYDACLIASSGWHDRMVKLWRRQSFGSEDTRFDFTYLPHPRAVTAIYWRRPPCHEHHHYKQIVDHVLYSVCIDGMVRIWAATDPHALQSLQLWAEIDMQQSIQPRQVGDNTLSNERCALFINCQDFATAANMAVEANAGDKDDEAHAIEHLKEVAKAKPDVCVVLDRRGNMSAWGLENVGCKSRKPTDVFNVAHIEHFDLPFLQETPPWKDNVQFFNFCNEQSSSPFTLLTHFFDGRILWSESSLDKLFEPSPRFRRLQTKALWTGHDEPVEKIVRNGSGSALISRTNSNEGLVWKQATERSAMLLTRQSYLNSNEHVHRTIILKEGDFALNLHPTSISLWDTQSLVARKVAVCRFESQDMLLNLLLLPTVNNATNVRHVVAVASKMSGVVWEVVLPPKHPSLPIVGGEIQYPSIREFCTFDVRIEDEMVCVLPIEPAGHPSTASGFLDSFAKDLGFSYTESGTLYGWSASVSPEKSTIKWHATAKIYTHIRDPFLAIGSSTRKVAFVDASKTWLTIWDMKSGQLEHGCAFGTQETIHNLDWSPTPHQQSVLAVGFQYRVMMFAQMRYDYMEADSAWAPLREIRIKELTSHPIGDSVWLGGGNLVVAAGNQLYVYDEDVSVSDDMCINLEAPIHKISSLNIFSLVSHLNGPLPVYHPQFLGQCILAGKLADILGIISALHKSLEFFVPGDELDNYLLLPPNKFFMDPKEELSGGSRIEAEDDEQRESLSEDVAATLRENLRKLSLPRLTSSQQLRLANIVQCVATNERHKRSMDDNATRFHISFNEHMLRKRQSPANHVSITWREIIWAFHSDSQGILVDLVSRHFHGRMLWEDVRECGMFMWMTDLTALRAQFEVIARNEYTKTDEKNPTDCSLYYLALKKKNVLLGLWRMAAWNREQAGTQKLLKNDFSEPRWKTAALKNAYALLGKRRFEYAAAWFLLADHLQDAVNVCAHHLEDLQLAIAVARVYEGDESPVFRSLLRTKILPQVALEGNRWLATWAFWMLGQRDMAVKALMEPLDNLVQLPRPPNIQAKSYLVNDPALIVLYKQLRENTLQTLKGAARISPQAEWEFIIQTARQYDRMGCDLLALDLVRNWKFLTQPSNDDTNGEMAAGLLKLTRRSSCLVQDDLQKSPTWRKEKQNRKPPPPPPTNFKEPEANSLLETFGF